MVSNFAVSMVFSISIISLGTESGLGSLLSNNRITSHFEANTEKLIVTIASFYLNVCNQIRSRKKLFTFEKLEF